MSTSLSSPVTANRSHPAIVTDPQVVAAARAHLMAAAARLPGSDPHSTFTTDAGTPIVASLVLDAADTDEATRSAAERALSAWLAVVGGTGASHYGVFAEGLAGRHLGLLAAAHVRPGLRRLAAASRRALVRRTALDTWRTSDVGWKTTT